MTPPLLHSDAAPRPAVAPLPAAPAAPALGWKDRVLGWRDALLASPRFHRWAAAFAPTRPIALRRSRDLFDLCAGFAYTQVLLACLRIDLFSRLSQAPRTAREIADATGLPPEGTARLLEAAAALRLLEPRGDGRFGLGPLGAPLVGHEALAAMIEHNTLLYEDLRDPLRLVRQPGGPTRLAGYWPYAAGGDDPAVPQRSGGYSALMAASQPLVAEEILDAYPVGRHRTLLDVGGGTGRFLRSAGDRHPHLRLMLFDLPAVAEQGRDELARAGFGARAAVHPGDFARDPLPAGADLISLVRVLHDHDDRTVRTLLRAAREALAPGGTLLIAEPLAGLRHAEALGAYFALYFLAMGNGRIRTAREYQAMLREAGFRGARLLRPRTPIQAGVIVARAS